MFEQMVLVQECGSKKKPIRIHSDNVQAGIDAGLYELRDPNWEMPSGKLRRKIHGDSTPKRRRGRPPKQESVEVAESDD